MIKPAGSERDIQIKKLQGYSEEIPAPPHWSCLCGIALKNPATGDLTCPGCNLIPYSTNRNDVWELWDELPKNKKYEIVNEQGEILHIITWDSGKFVPIIGEDFADCVSQAWIIWKEKSK